MWIGVTPWLRFPGHSGKPATSLCQGEPRAQRIDASRRRGADQRFACTCPFGRSNDDGCSLVMPHMTTPIARATSVGSHWDSQCTFEPLPSSVAKRSSATGRRTRTICQNASVRQASSAMD